MNLINTVEKAKNEYGPIHARIENDTSFESGKQWDDEEAKRRYDDGRPSRTTNICRTYINRIANPYLKNPFTIEVDVEGEDNKPIAEGLGSIINDIEEDSGAIAKYYDAFRDNIVCGYGYLVARPKYKSERTTEQTVVIDIIPPQEVAIDKADEPQWAVITQNISLSIAKSLGYEPESEVEDSIFKEVELSTVYTLESITTKRAFRSNSEYQDFGDESEIDSSFEMVRDIQTTKLSISRVIEGVEIGKAVTYAEMDRIPIVQLQGERSFVDGEYICTGMISRMNDSQIQTNRTNSLVEEVLEQISNDPYIATAQQIKGLEKYWDGRDKKLRRVRLYNGINQNGSPLPPPQRTGMEQNLGLALSAKENATGDMARASAVTDGMLGDGEVAGIESGVAIAQKQYQGEISTIVYTYNFKEALRKFGMILLKFHGAITPQITIEVDEQEVAIPKDKYAELLEMIEISVVAGPHEVEARHRNRMVLSELMPVMPQIAPLLGIEILRESDMEGKEELIEKAMKILPPEWQDQDDKQVDPAAEQAMQAAQSTIDQLNTQNDYLISVLRQFQAQQVDDEKDRANKLEIEKIKAEASITEQQIQSNTVLEKAKIDSGSASNQAMINRIAEKEKAEIDVMGSIATQSIQVDESMMKPINPQGVEEVGPIPPMADGPVKIDRIE